MKLLFSRLYAAILIFALLAVSGCGGVNSTSDSSELFDGSVSLYSLNPLNAEKESREDIISSQSDKAYSSSENSTVSEKAQTSSESNISSGATAGGVSSNTVSATTKETFYFKGLWISYFELAPQGCDRTEARSKFSNMMRSAAAQGYNAVFCHVRSHADAFYPSDYFPFSKYLTGTQGVDPGYDPLKIMISCAKAYGLEFHAWINPYRVSSDTTDPTTLSSDNIAAKWLTDGSGRAVVSGNGIYFNPAEADVQKLVLNGIKEIVNNYDVDGIHFDDYFYPTTSTSFDSKAYSEYKAKTQTPLSLADWRRANVNTLVSSAYRICKQKGVTFGISPAGDISTDNTDRNYTSLYADVALWMKTPGYADYIIPQIYFGYEHPKENSRYTRLLNIWCDLPRHSDLKLYIGLAAYKMDEPCDDSVEWHNDSTLMARQATDAKAKGANGIAVFSYSASLSQKEFNALQIKNMFNAIKS